MTTRPGARSREPGRLIDAMPASHDPATAPVDARTGSDADLVARGLGPVAERTVAGGTGRAARAGARLLAVSARGGEPDGARALAARRVARARPGRNRSRRGCRRCRRIGPSPSGRRRRRRTDPSRSVDRRRHRIPRALRDLSRCGARRSPRCPSPTSPSRWSRRRAGRAGRVDGRRRGGCRWRCSRRRRCPPARHRCRRSRPTGPPRAGRPLASAAAESAPMVWRLERSFRATGPVTSTPAATSTAPPLSSSPAPPAAPSSARRAALGGTLVAAPAAQMAIGVGVTAVAAARSVARARWTSWRTAPSVRPRSCATCARLSPPTAVRRSASRWLNGSAATPASVSRITVRRSRSVSGPSGERRDSVSSS